MDNINLILNKFILQAKSGDLKTASYPKEWGGFRMKVSFGMGAPARVPWIAFTSEEMRVSNGFYPVYLYYRELEVLILAYGISETEDFGETWPVEIMNGSETIASFLNHDVPRYGNSFVFKAYSIHSEKNRVVFSNAENNKVATEIDLTSDLETILGYYQRIITDDTAPQTASIQSQGLFYMEKQLEDFIIHNWSSTELGKRFDLIIE